MRVLVTGGLGFIGSHLVDALVERGDQVSVLDSLSPQVHPGGVPAWTSSEVRLWLGDVCDGRLLSAALSGVDRVVHLAAETGTGQSLHAAVDYVRTNVTGMAALLDAMARAPECMHLVLASSRAVYGEGIGRCSRCAGAVPLATRTLERLRRHDWSPRCGACGAVAEPSPTPETAPARPASVYGVTKDAQERLLEVASQSGLVRGHALRLQNVFGPRQALGNPYTGILAAFVNRLLNGLPTEIYEDGGPTRDFVHVADVVAAILALLDRPPEGYDVFNVGSGRGITIRELERTVRALCAPDAPPPLELHRFRPGDIRAAVAEVDKARTRLAWRPQRALREGLAEFVAWARRAGPAEDRSEVAFRELADYTLPRPGPGRPGAGVGSAQPPAVPVEGGRR